MKRQQLEKMLGKKITGGYGGGRRKGGGGKAQAPAGTPPEDGKVPIAVRLIRGLDKK